jgi:hypothetical protein
MILLKLFLIHIDTLLEFHESEAQLAEPLKRRFLICVLLQKCVVFTESLLNVH